jgi:hypothetical protein
MVSNKIWLKHVALLTLGLLIFYAVSYIVIYTTIMSPATSAAIVAASIKTGNPGLTPGAEIASSVGAIFPAPFVLWVIGVILCKWIAF